jgi:RNA polymerase sigma factor (TIGR02999 family)
MGAMSLTERVLGAETVSRLMRDLRYGDQAAKQELVRLLYPELRRIAASKMKHERANHTLQPTAVVNELYLELLKVRGLAERGYADDEEKAAFMGLAGRLMDRLLIHHARRLPNRVQRIELDDSASPADSGAESLRHVEDALIKLEGIDPLLRTVVEMKVFEGLTGEEIAGRLGCSPRTVVTHWAYARQWLLTHWAGRIPA